MNFFPEQASNFAKDIDSLYTFLVVVALFFTGLIFSLIIFFSIRYRRKSELERPVHIEGHNWLETLWTVIPLALTMVMFVWGTAIFFNMSTPPKDAMEIYVVGKQWMWKIQHPNGRREINHLHVPKGKAVKLTMTSEDVVHSFYIPAFRTKMDVVPGRYSSLWFRPTQEGQYHLFCAEYCGTAHSQMIGQVIVMSPEAYDVWLETGEETQVAKVSKKAGVSQPVSTKPESMVARGKKTYERFKCDTCHNGSVGALGPDLQGLFGKQEKLKGGQTVKVDETYLRDSIINPQAQMVEGFMPVMPTYKGQMSEEEVMEIVEYIKSLKK